MARPRLKLLSTGFQPIEEMSPQKPDLEARAEALLQRIQRHNQGRDTLTASEVRSLLEEIRAIGDMNLADSLPGDVLARVDRTMRQAVKEARTIVVRASGRETK